MTPKIKKERRSKTPKKGITKSDSKIHISNTSKRAFKRRKKGRKAGGVIYIGHIPHGFYEDEMKSYFNQFGKVLATVVARSKKTGRSKGYGFVEFKDEEVAKIAAETMNNYLMFNRILKCRYIPPEESKGRIHEKNISAYDFPRQKNRKINQKQKEKAFSNLTQSKYLEKAERKIDEFKKFFADKGIDFSFQLNSKVSKSEEKTNKMKTTSNVSSEVESKDDTDGEFGILEIDESESEIYFKTPPKVKKVIKKSISSSTTPKQDTDSGKCQGKKSVKKSNLNKTQKKGKIVKKTNGSVTSVSKKLGQKIKNKEKSLKAKEFLKKDLSAVTKLRKEKAVGNGATTRKKQKNAKQTLNMKQKIKISVKAEN